MYGSFPRPIHKDLNSTGIVSLKIKVKAENIDIKERAGIEDKAKSQKENHS